MSLYLRLWITIAVVMLLTFAGSFVLSNLSSRDWFEQQLERKNLDNATTLGLLLSSPGLDQLSRELLVSAQFDSGHYQFIRLTDKNDTLLIERTQPQPEGRHPQWFEKWFPIVPANGVAQVSQGWQQIGTLTLRSHTQLAYDALWSGSVQLFSYFVLAGVLCCALGTMLLRLVTRPLEDLVEQAHAITERRFITRNEPGPRELRHIVRAMNTLSLHIKKMLAEEAARLDSWRINMQYDPLTGLMNRQPCLAQLNALLARNDASAAGSIMLIQLQDLELLNHCEGRRAVDHLLKSLGETLNTESRQFDERLIGRLNGADLLLAIPGFYQAEQLGKTVYQALLLTASQQSFSERINLHCVVSPFRAGDKASALLHSLDNCLSVQPADTSSFTVQTAPPENTVQQMPWQRRLDEALNKRGIQLQYFPTVNQQRQLTHLDACARLKSDSGPSLAAGVFMSSLRQMGWCHRLDEVVLSEALARLEVSSRPLAISLSAAIFRDNQLAENLLHQLENAGDAAQNLRLEFASNDAFLYMDTLKELCMLVKPMGCQIGLKHLGHHLGNLDDLADSGLDYARIDGSFVRQLDQDTEVKPFIQGLCSTLHTLGIQVLAEQVATESQWQQLLALGIDGGTGPLFTEARTPASAA